MNIMITNYMETKYPGGINKTIYEIAKNLSAKGHRVTVLQPNLFDLPEEEIYEGFKIIRVKSMLKDFYGLNSNIYFYLKNNLEKLNVDLVHINGYQTLFSSLVIKGIKKVNKNIPIIFSPHMDVYRNTFAGKHFWKLFDFYARSIFDESDYIISPSEFEAQTIMDTYKLPRNKIFVIPSGVDSFSFRQKNKKFSFSQNQEENKTLRLIYSGHLVERKGVDLILRALKSLVIDLNFENVTLTVIGTGDEKSKLLKLSKKLKIEEHVIWKPFLSGKDYSAEMEKADISLLLSHSEAYGLTVAEFLAMGTPVIVTKTTALTEFLGEDGCFGVDYPPDPQKVAELIRDIIKSPVKVGPFSDKIRTWDRISDDYENVYRTILADGEINHGLLADGGINHGNS